MCFYCPNSSNQKVKIATSMVTPKFVTICDIATVVAISDTKTEQNTFYLQSVKTCFLQSRNNAQCH